LATSVFLLSFALSGCLQYLAPNREVHRITKEDLRSLLGNPDVIIVDVRIEKDINTWADRYPEDKTLVFYCA
jgi:hypothetical protein